MRNLHEQEWPFSTSGGRFTTSSHARRRRGDAEPEACKRERAEEKAKERVAATAARHAAQEVKRP